MPRIMIVDDSPVVRAANFETLEPLGFELGQAENGREALEMGLRSRWDLLLLDLAMPEMNGIEALTELRARGCSAPAVLVTSSSAATRIAAAVRLGGVQYLAKPYTPETLKAVVLKLLHVDLAALGPPPRALVQHVTPDLPAVLRTLLPRHIQIDATPSLAESLDLAAAQRHSLVLFENAGALRGDETTLAQVARGVLPTAGIFALTPGATSAPWAPEGELDGRLPLPVDRELVASFLYPTFLRPLVFVQRSTLVLAGDEGAPHLRVAYREMLARRVVERCGALGLDEPCIDARNLPGSVDEVVDTVLHLNHVLRAQGGAPVFDLPACAHGAPGLSKVLVV